MRNDRLMIMNSVRSIASAIRNQSNKAQNELGLNAAQIFIVREVLNKSDGITINELAARTHTHQSTVSTVVSRLCKLGWLEKRIGVQDKRQTSIFIVEEQRKKIQKNTVLIQDKMFHAIDSMPEDQRSKFAELLTTFCQQCGIYVEEAPMFDEDNE